MLEQMEGSRAVAKAVALLGVKRVVPTHFGTFPLLTGTPEALVKLLPGEVELWALVYFNYLFLIT